MAPPMHTAIVRMRKFRITNSLKIEDRTVGLFSAFRNLWKRDIAPQAAIGLMVEMDHLLVHMRRR